MSAGEQLESFLARYTPEMGKLAKACLKKLRARLPGATQMVYDNYNALVIGFGPSPKVSHAILSLALYPRHANLFFLQGTFVPDPHKLLKGSGNKVRSIRVESAGILDDPKIQELIEAAKRSAVVPIDPGATGELIIKAISPNQRPRLPRA